MKHKVEPGRFLATRRILHPSIPGSLYAGSGSNYRCDVQVIDLLGESDDD